MKNSLQAFFANNANILKVSYKYGRKYTLLYIMCGFIRNARYPLVAFVSAQLVLHTGLSLDQGNISVFLLLYLAFYFLLFALNRVWWPLNAYASNMLLSKLQFGFKSVLCKKTLNADYASFEDPEWLNNLELARAELNGRRPIQVIDQVISMVCAVGCSAAMFIPLLAYRPIWAVFMLIGAYGAFWANAHFGAKVYQYEKTHVQLKRRMTYITKLVEDRSAMKEVFSQNLFDHMSDRMQSLGKQYNQGLQKAALQQILGTLVAWLCNNLVSVVFYTLLVLDALSGGISLSMLSFYLAAMESISDMIQQISQSFGSINRNRQYVSNLLRFLESSPNTVAQEEEKPTQIQAEAFRLEFRDVSFQYPKSESYALRHVTFALEGKGATAIVGMNGAGKSTLIKLLLRLYEPTEGAIYFNGININTYSLPAWRALFDVCFQDFYHYAFPIKDVISLCDMEHDADLDAVRDVLQKMDLHALFDGMPEQYDTCLSKAYDVAGVELSGGQKQKISIARVLYGHAPFVVMDEPTSAIDARMERKVLQLFQDRVKNGVGVIVTHRLAYAAQADHILVFKGGELAEFGDHSTLMQYEGGIYRELFETQAKRYMAEEAEFE